MKKPKKFNRYNKPYPPTEPLKTWETSKIIESWNDTTDILSDILGKCSDYDFSKLYFTIDGGCSSDCGSIELRLKYDVPNPRYEVDYKRYLKEKKKYDADIEWYNEELKKLETKEKTQSKIRERNLYEKLKKKYEKATPSD